MNKVEQIKAERDGFEIGADLPKIARNGWEAIEESDRERLKWWGIFFRRQSPGLFMMRIRVTGGLTNALQLRAVAEISRRFGRGQIDITTRQQFQLRWLRIEHVPEMLRLLQETGLLTWQTGMDNIRNVVGCPLAGRTAGELFDATAVLRSFAHSFLGNRAYTNLPRKFNVTITGCRDNCTHAESQDLSLVPATQVAGEETASGFNVFVGGKTGSGGYEIALPLDVFVMPDEAVSLCQAVVMTFRDHGSREARNRARLRFLIDDWGIARFRDEIERRVGHPLSRAGTDARRTEDQDHIGIFRQKQEGCVSFGLLVPVGRLDADALTEIARLAEQYGKGDVLLTTNQNVILPDVPETRVHALQSEPLLQRFRYDPSELMRGLVSCTGSENCHLALIETKKRAVDVTRLLESRLGTTRPVRIHWSGCPAGCGNHAIADIGLLGKKVRYEGAVVEAVDVFLGGASGAGATQPIKVLEDVPCDHLPGVLENLIRFGGFKNLRKQLHERQEATTAAPQQRSPPAPPPALDAPLREDDLIEGAGRRVLVDGNDVAVFKVAGQIYAIQNICPHEGGSLSSGVVDRGEVQCPLHAYRFSLRDGACATDPSLCARTFPVRVENGRIQVTVPAPALAR